MAETLLQKAQRLGIQPAGKPKEEPKSSFISRVSEDIKQSGQAVEEAISGTGQFTEQTPIRRGFEAVSQAAGGVINVATEALPEPARTGLEKVGKMFSGVINWLGEKIGSTKLAQDFVTKHPDAARTLEEISGATEAAGTIAGSILAAEGGVRTVAKTADLTKVAATKTAGAITDITAGAIDTAKTALSKTKSWVQQPLKASVQTVLKETPIETFDNYVDLARKATQNNKNITPLEYAGTRAQQALDQMNRKLDAVGSNKTAIVESSAGRIPVGNIVMKFRQRLQNAIKSKVQVEGNKKVYQDILSEAEKLGDNPSAMQVDKFIDFVQDRIYTGKRDLTIPITNDVQQTLRPITGELNEALKNKLPESYRNLNDRYSELVDTRNELNLKLGVEGEKGGALMKRVFSPSDANTKKLFADILDETGIDLVNEATLARYVMDVLGDARQKSMLEQLNISIGKPTAGSLTTRLIDYLIEKANSPEELIRRARLQTVSGGVSKP